ncbi:MAG: FHA domain-containing protein, partial [Anaerolineae bacterium]|nr:FHA domain-containing protein [Anaerolineae bacterium]
QCDFQVNDTWVSRQHARITWGGAGYLIEDLNTVNGTYINGERINAPRALRSGDVLQLGTQVVLGFQAGAPVGTPEAAPVPASQPAPPSEPVPPSEPAQTSRPAPAPAFPNAAPIPESAPASPSGPAPTSGPAPPAVVPEVAPAAESEPAPSPAATADTAMEEAQKAASSALTSAIVGLIICGLILEPSAIMQARKARKVLGPGDPGYGKAIAAEIIGWIGLALWIVVIIWRLSNM